MSQSSVITALCMIYKLKPAIRKLFFLNNLYRMLLGKQEEESFYQQIGLKFEEETSEMLRLEHGSVWC